MRLSTFSDYSLRVLMYLGVHDQRLATVGEIALGYGVSENHLVKVVHYLSQRRYLETSRGKGGGIRLARPPERINVGEVLRQTENMTLVECFERRTSNCRIDRSCLLKGILGHAVEAFFAALEQYTLADLLRNKPVLAKMLVAGPIRPRA